MPSPAPWSVESLLAEEQPCAIPPSKPALVVLEERALRKFIGRSAYAVWRAFLPERGVNNRTICTIMDVMRVTHLSHRQVQRALVRLRTVGLLRVGNRRFSTEPWKGPKRFLLARYIYGGLSLGGQPAVPPAVAEAVTAFVPTHGGARAGAGRPKTPRVQPPETSATPTPNPGGETALAPPLKGRAGWGGARPGAGRPKGAKDTRPRATRPKNQVCSPKNQVCPPAQGSEVPMPAPTHTDCTTSASPAKPQLGPKDAPNNQVPNNQVGLDFGPNNQVGIQKGCDVKRTPKTSVNPSKEPSGFFLSSLRSDKKKRGTLTPTYTAEGGDGTTCLPAAPAGGAAPAAPAGSVFFFLEAEREGEPVTASWGVTAPPRVADPLRVALGAGVSRVREGVPGLVPSPAVVVPSPPSLRDKDTEDKHLLLLAKAYEGAVLHVFGLKAWAFASQRCAPSVSKYAGLLRAARTWCLKNDIAPAVWCFFAAHRWRTTQAGESSKRPPPVEFVFSAQLMNSCLDWVRTASYHLGGFRVRGPRAAEFFSRQAQYAQRLRVAKADPLEVVQQVWGSVAAWEDFRAAAQDETVALLADLKAQVADGAWVWREPLRVIIHANGRVKWR